MRYDVNLSILFTELPLLERPSAAAAFEVIDQVPGTAFLTDFYHLARMRPAEGFATAPQGNVTQTSHKHVTKQNPPSPNATNTFEIRGGGTVAQTAATADVVITMLPNHPQVEAVALGESGVLHNAKPGTLYLDMSTIRPETSRRLAEVGQRRDIRVLDAPVSGGERGAIDGVLSIMVGGAADDFAAAAPVFEPPGRTVVHVGPVGAGQTVKAANQLVVGGTYALVAEAIVLLEAAGLDAGLGLNVLAGGLAGSRILELKRHSMVDRQFAPGFRIDLHHKDMGIILDAAREAGVALPVGNLVAALIAAARAQGHGSLDHSALLKVTESLSGKGAVA